MFRTLSLSLAFALATLPGLLPAADSEARALRALPPGNPHRFACADFTQGKVVREIPAPGGPHRAIRLPNGHTLIACGDLLKDGARVFEVDQDGRVVWGVGPNELPGISLKFMTGLQRLPNGNTLMSNWLGHGHLGQAPHLIEVTPDKKVVWTFADHRHLKTIASVQVMDADGAAGLGAVWH